MPTPQELEEKFWKSLKSDMTMMIGLDGVEDGHARPLTAQLIGDKGPIWFFTSKDTAIYNKITNGSRATATFISKGHDLFASVHGGMHIDNDRAVIDKLWNKFIAAWFEGGKHDPNLGLLRLDPDRGQIWQDANNWISGVKMLLGVDPKKDYKDNMAKVALND